MDISETKVGGYYRRGTVDFVIKVDRKGMGNDEIFGPELRPESRSFIKTGHRWTRGEYYQAAPIEIAHLEACLRADKYVPYAEPESTNDNYLIFT